MHVAITGSSGLVGKALVARLTTDGHRVTRILRRSGGEGTISWDPARGKLDPADLHGLDAVIHLAGENIAGKRWNAKVKAAIRDSRCKGTRLLSEAIAQATPKPAALISASAIGFYGQRGDEIMTEEQQRGTGFLAEVCQEWEDACQPARDAGVRVVNVRIGVVLAKTGGALQKMLLPFKMGVGGIVGNGRQYWSWVALEDLIGILSFLTTNSEINGPVNAVADCAVTNREFTKTLGKVLRRPTIMPLPAFAAKLMLGEMAESLLLASVRVVPKKLTDAGFEFQFPDLESAFRHELAS